jgi:hypothetical protein
MERVPQPANTNEMPKLSLEEMEAAIEEAQSQYEQLKQEFEGKDFYGADTVVKKREIDERSAKLAALLRTKVPNEKRVQNRLPNFPRYEGLPLEQKTFPAADSEKAQAYRAAARYDYDFKPSTDHAEVDQEGRPTQRVAI